MGASEEAIGNKNLGAEFSVWTKAPTGLGGGAGKRENILEQGRISNEVLKLSKVNFTVAIFKPLRPDHFQDFGVLSPRSRRVRPSGRDHGRNPNAVRRGPL